MFFEVTHPLYVLSASGDRSSRVIGFETAGGEVVEVFTEYGSVPASPAIVEALRPEVAP
ncbi:hypothetical protein [Actinoplanes sp. NPDC049802]|uniref:hypothetical protein n=1 Tax=Actinoplanes sp. NPDC049802 TaxID=3154742 RepID=UPI0033F82C54